MARTFPRKEILQHLCTTLSGIAKTYASDRPSSVTESIKSFIVVDLPGTMKDHNAYQDATLRIDLFQKEKQHGIEDVSGLEILHKSVFDLFPIVNDTFSAISPRLVAGGSDGKGFYFLMIYANILTK